MKVLPEWVISVNTTAASNRWLPRRLGFLTGVTLRNFVTVHATKAFYRQGDYGNSTHLGIPTID